MDTPDAGRPVIVVPPTAMRAALDVVAQLAERTQMELQRVTDENVALQQQVRQLTAAHQDTLHTLQELSAPHARMLEADVDRRIMATELSRLESATASRDFAGLVLCSTRADASGALLEMLACELFRLQVCVAHAKDRREPALTRTPEPLFHRHSPSGNPAPIAPV